MTKADFTEEIARVLGMSRKEAQTVLDAMLDGMVSALRKGERVEIRGFGSLSTYVRAARQGRNPRTGVRVDVPAKRVPAFKAAAELKALLAASGSGEM